MRQPPPGQSRVYRVTHLRTDSVHRRESTGKEPVVLKVVRVTGAVLPIEVTSDTTLVARVELWTTSQFSSADFVSSILDRIFSFTLVSVLHSEKERKRENASK